jgi:hypothetical protein
MHAFRVEDKEMIRDACWVSEPGYFLLLMLETHPKVVINGI